MERTTLARNQALSFNQLESLSQNPTVSKWLNERNEASSDGERERLGQDKRLQGRGGGAFISFRNFRQDATVILKLFRIDAMKNSAITGGNTSRNRRCVICDCSGGIYFENENINNRQLDYRSHDRVVRPSSVDVNYTRMGFVNNTASAAGGGVFVHVLDSARSYGILEESLAVRECVGLNPFMTCYRNNRITVGKLSVRCDGYF